MNDLTKIMTLKTYKSPPTKGPRLKPSACPTTSHPASIVRFRTPTIRWSEQYLFAYIQNVKPKPDTIRLIKMRYRKFALYAKA